MGNLIFQNLSKFYNAQKSYKSEVCLTYSKNLLKIIEILRTEGYIRGFYTNSSGITVFLKYFNNRSPFKTIRLVSKPSRRIFYSYNDLLKKEKADGFFILNTSFGILSSKLAIKKNIGGEVIFFIN
jgi:small subunit ribosomal protein S8